MRGVPVSLYLCAALVLVGSCGYQIRLDGTAATSLVFGGTPPPGTTTYGFNLGRAAGESHRVRIRARLPDGTRGALSAERTVTTGTATAR